MPVLSTRTLAKLMRAAGSSVQGMPPTNITSLRFALNTAETSQTDMNRNQRGGGGGEPDCVRTLSLEDDEDEARSADKRSALDE